MAGDIDGRQSTSGVLVFLGSSPISWLSLKQKVVALSTCEAEYVAAATAACQVVWLRRLLGELTGVEAHPPALMVDNQLAIALAKNLILQDRSKHIDMKFHFLRDGCTLHLGSVVAHEGDSYSLVESSVVHLSFVG